MSPVASPLAVRLNAKGETALACLNLPAVPTSNSPFKLPYIQAGDLLADCMIDSWSKVRPGDLLTDNRGVLEQVLKVTALPGAEPNCFRVETCRSENGINYARVIETRDDRDFAVQRGLTVISRQAASALEVFLPRTELTGPEASMLRRSAAEALVDSLVNRSLGFSDQAVTRLGGEKHAEAFAEMRGYQALLKQFKGALDTFDLSSHRTLAILSSLSRAGEYRAVHYLPGMVTPFSLGEEYLSVLRKKQKAGSPLADELGEAASKVTEVWHALRAFRTQSWLINDKEFEHQGKPATPPVTTRFYRGQVPENIIQNIYQLIVAEHRAPDSVEATERGIIFDAFTPEDLAGAISAGAHLLVAFDGFESGCVAGFMLYYPPSASLPPGLQALKQEHINISTAIVDLVCISADAPRQTFNHLFWGHRFALQATSDAKIHVGELMLNNLSSYTALVSRGAVAEPVAEISGDDWQRMTVPVDVDEYVDDINPYAAALIEGRKEIVTELRQRLAGDMTHGELLQRGSRLSERLHVHIPDWTGLIEGHAYQLLADCLSGALRDFSGLITGPTRERHGISASAAASNDAASLLGSLAGTQSQALLVGLFPYPRESAHYQGTGSTSFGYPAESGSDGLPADRITPDSRLSRRMKIAVEKGGDIRSEGEFTALDISRELEQFASTRGTASRHLLVIPQAAISLVPEVHAWIAHADQSPAFQVAVVADQLSNGDQTVSGKGIYRVSSPEEFRLLVNTLRTA